MQLYINRSKSETPTTEGKYIVETIGGRTRIGLFKENGWYYPETWEWMKINMWLEPMEGKVVVDSDGVEQKAKELKNNIPAGWSEDEERGYKNGIDAALQLLNQ